MATISADSKIISERKMTVYSSLSTQKKNRIESIDVLRGLTIFVMIFVNDLASVKGIPWWMQHMPENTDGMTFVDVVFPAFLFIVGMSIPFSINKRIASGESLFVVWKHILIRTAGLLILGILMVNISSLNSSVVGMSHSVWMLLVFIGAVLVWNQYPKAEGKKKLTFNSFKFLGIILLIYLALIFRSGQPNNLGWLQTKWWGILGLIGWAFFFSSAVYIIFRKQPAGIIGMFIIFILLYIGDKSGALGNFYSQNIKNYFWLGGHIGAHTAITLSGIIVSLLFLENSPAKTPKEKIVWIIVFATMMFVVGFLLRPLYGISKIYATPTWSLYSSAICSVIYALLYWIVDIKNKVGWAKFLKPAGTNPLLAYLLPDIFYSVLWIFGINFLSEYFGYGVIGIIRSLIFSLIMLALTALFNKWNVRLHL